MLRKKALSLFTQNWSEVVRRPAVEEFLIGDDQLLAVLWSLKPLFTERSSSFDVTLVQGRLLHHSISLETVSKAIVVNSLPCDVKQPAFLTDFRVTGTMHGVFSDALHQIFLFIVFKHPVSAASLRDLTVTGGIDAMHPMLNHLELD